MGIGLIPATTLKGRVKKVEFLLGEGFVVGRVQKITMGSAENPTFFGSQIFWSEFGQNCFKMLVRIRSEFWKFGSEWLSGNTGE